MAYQINQEWCSGCHYCACECPTKAISYVGLSYGIDADRCVECGRCVSVCNNGAITKSDAVPNSVPAHEKKHLDADIVVIGAGASGLVAAVRAAQLGHKKVIVLEKAKNPGGSAWYATFLLALGCRWESEIGLPDTREEMLRALLHNAPEGSFDEELVRTALYACGPFFDWLLDLGGDEALEMFRKIENVEVNPMLGYSFGCVGQAGRKFYNLKNTDSAIGPGHGGSFVFRTMLKSCASNGIEILTEHEATKILLDQNNAVCGVLCKDLGGEIEISCSACFVGAGGWARNKKLMEKYLPDAVIGEAKPHIFPPPTTTGDGIMLAEQAGARIDWDNLCAHMFGPVHHPFGYFLLLVGWMPQIMSVTQDGRRWFDEMPFGGEHGMSKIPGAVSWQIVDQKIMTQIAEQLKREGNKMCGLDPSVDEYIFTHCQDEIDEESALEVPLKRADTLEKLADLMGVNKENFLAEVARYNGFCAAGEDRDFHKSADFLVPIDTPPFYGIYGQRAIDGAVGGVVVDCRMRVLNQENKPITGLYAGGDNTAGWATNVGNGYKECSINDLTWAVTSGFVAGNEMGSLEPD